MPPRERTANDPSLAAEFGGLRVRHLGQTARATSTPVGERLDRRDLRYATGHGARLLGARVRRGWRASPCDARGWRSATCRGRPRLPASSEKQRRGRSVSLSAVYSTSPSSSHSFAAGSPLPKIPAVRSWVARFRACRRPQGGEAQSHHPGGAEEGGGGWVAFSMARVKISCASAASIPMHW